MKKIDNTNPEYIDPIQECDNVMLHIQRTWNGVSSQKAEDFIQHYFVCGYNDARYHSYRVVHDVAHTAYINRLQNVGNDAIANAFAAIWWGLSTHLQFRDFDHEAYMKQANEMTMGLYQIKPSPKRWKELVTKWCDFAYHGDFDHEYDMFEGHVDSLEMGHHFAQRVSLPFVMHDNFNHGRNRISALREAIHMQGMFIRKNNNTVKSLESLNEYIAKHENSPRTNKNIELPKHEILAIGYKYGSHKIQSEDENA